MGQQHLKFAIFGNEYQAKKSASIEKILLIWKRRKLKFIFKASSTIFLPRWSILR